MTPCPRCSRLICLNPATCPMLAPLISACAGVPLPLGVPAAELAPAHADPSCTRDAVPRTEPEAPGGRLAVRRFPSSRVHVTYWHPSKGLTL